jgi:hypothetical protein
MEPIASGILMPLKKGTILRFRIQFEAMITGKWYAIVRYDTAHGFPHRDLIHPDGSQEKFDFPGWDRNEVLTFGERELKTNWQKYRVEFEKEMKK